MLSQAIQRKCRERGIPYIATSKEEVDPENERAVQMHFETAPFTHVINCAAYTAVDQAEKETTKAYRLNASAVALLATLSKKRGNKLIHFSTDYVFDGVKGRYVETDQTAPLSAYGRSKEAGEQLLLKHCPHALLIRTSWLFGKEGLNFVTKMITLMGEKETMTVVNDQKGRPTYADDLAAETLSLLDASGLYHFANEGETTWYGFASAIWETLQYQGKTRCQSIEPISTETGKGLAKRPCSSVLLTQKCSPRHWKEGLKEVIEHATLTE